MAAAGRCRCGSAAGRCRCRRITDPSQTAGRKVRASIRWPTRTSWPRSSSGRALRRSRYSVARTMVGQSGVLEIVINERGDIEAPDDARAREQRVRCGGADGRQDLKYRPGDEGRSAGQIHEAGGRVAGGAREERGIDDRPIWRGVPVSRFLRHGISDRQNDASTDSPDRN